MQAPAIPAPFRKSLVVQPSWIDPNGHMNVAFYLSAFDQGSDPFFDHCGIGWDYTRAGAGSVFATGCNLDFRRELLEGDALEVTTRLLDFDQRLLHLWCELARQGDAEPAATYEALFMHVSLETRRSRAFPPSVCSRLAAVRAAHGELPRPATLGRRLEIRR